MRSGIGAGSGLGFGASLPRGPEAGRSGLRGAALAVLLGTLLAGCSKGTDPVPTDLEGIALRKVMDGLEEPVFLLQRPGHPELYGVEQGGLVRVWNGQRLLAEPFLDVRSIVTSGYEQGLLGLAFQDELAYVHYTDRAGDTMVAAYAVTCGHNQ